MVVSLKGPQRRVSWRRVILVASRGVLESGPPPLESLFIRAVVRAPFPFTDGDRAAVIAQLAKLFGNPGPEVGWLPREQPWPAD